MNSEPRWCDDPRIHASWHVDGMRTRDLDTGAFLAAGFSEAEAWSLYYAQWHTFRSPLVCVIDAVLSAKAEHHRPLLAHERRELRRRMLAKHLEALERKGADWFEFWKGPRRLVATLAGTLCDSDLDATAR